MTTGRINQVAALRWEAREDQPKPVPTHHPTVQSFSDCQVQIRQSHVERSERACSPKGEAAHRKARFPRGPTERSIDPNNQRFERGTGCARPSDRMNDRRRIATRPFRRLGRGASQPPRSLGKLTATAVLAGLVESYVCTA